MKTELLAQNARRIVFGVDQEPFDSGASRFCIGMPLFIEETGERLDPKDFPNRGRIWWMLRGVQDDQLLPGNLHVGTLERSMTFGNPEQNKDHYQVRLKAGDPRTRREASSPLWDEVLVLPGKAPPIDDLIGGGVEAGVPSSRRPWPRLFTVFEDAALGPFTGTWSLSQARVHLRAPEDSAERIWRFDRQQLLQDKRLLQLSWEVNAQHPSPLQHPRKRISIALIRREFESELAEQGKPIQVLPLARLCATLSRRVHGPGRGPLSPAEILDRIENLAREDESLGPWLERLRALHERYQAQGLPGLRQLGPTDLGEFTRLLSIELPRRELAPALERPKPLGGLAPVGRPVSPSAKPAAEARPGTPKEPPSEAAFLEEFERQAMAQGIAMDKRDLAVFHVALKSGSWHVVAGPSGTGKSTLPQLYSLAMGDPGGCLLAPVRPDWLDERDVIGAWDSLSQRFIPAPTGILDFLISARAQGQAQGLRLLVLDEMNLGRVEHYFASFLSLLEGGPTARVLRLFDKRLVDPSDRYAAYDQISLPPNLRIVGTVNVDETTHFFSPKMLDRAGIQVLEPGDLRAGLQARQASAPAPSAVPVTWSAWSAWVQPASKAPEWAVDRLVELDEVLAPMRSGFGHRVFQRCLRFVACAERILPENEALDRALAMFVLPRLRTEHPRAQEQLPRAQGLLGQDEFPLSSNLLRRLWEGEGQHDFWQLL
jgi:hypothetical protein